MGPPDSTPAPEILAAGDQAWLVRYGEAFDPNLTRAAQALARRLAAEPIEGVVEVMPTIASVLVRFDPLMADPSAIRGALDAATAEVSMSRTTWGRSWRLPVLYGDEAGSDLDAAAAQLGMSAAQLIEAHAASELQVLMLGFAPGFLYAGLLDETWDLPRRAQIHDEVLPGSVLLAVRQTAVTATRVPTGWHVIGRTPFLNFAPARNPPVLIESGDTIGFEPVDVERFETLETRAKAGQSVVEPESADQ